MNGWNAPTPPGWEQVDRSWRQWWTQRERTLDELAERATARNTARLGPIDRLRGVALQGSPVESARNRARYSARSRVNARRRLVDQ